MVEGYSHKPRLGDMVCSDYLDERVDRFVQLNLLCCDGCGQGKRRERELPAQ